MDGLKNATGSLGFLLIATLLAGSGCELIAGIDRDKIPGAGGNASVGGAGGVDAVGGADPTGGSDPTGGGGTGGAGGSAGCETASDCGTDTECVSYACDAGACSETFAPAGTACTDGGDICDGNGMCVVDTCMDGMVNGDETDVDCGGAVCSDCAQGQDCNVDGDCATGACADGVCCDTACAGACDACSVAAGASSDGTCAIVAAGGAGDPTCAPYVCDGSAASCPTICTGNDDCVSGVSCSDGFCCDQPCQGLCQSCSAADTGGADGTCAPVLADTDPNGDCGNGELCDGAGACKGSLGTACSAGADCLSGMCVDGVCCDGACNGVCESCNQGGMAGTCSPDPNGTPCASDNVFCNGAEICQGGACTSPGDPCDGPDGDGDCSETCDETADACTGNDPDGLACDDGSFCNGTEICSGGVCGSSTGSPCMGSEFCDEGGMGQCVVLWINEFHYDNSGADVGEFVEVAIAAGADLSTITVTLYDGADGTVYGTHPLTSFTAGTTVSGITLHSKAITDIQNGADGICLDAGGVGVVFLSYEGAFTATDGPCSGMTATDVGVNENGAATGTSVSLQGTGSTGSDFTWAAGVAETPGAPNTGQTIN